MFRRLNFREGVGYTLLGIALVSLAFPFVFWAVGATAQSVCGCGTGHSIYANGDFWIEMILTAAGGTALFRAGWLAKFGTPGMEWLTGEDPPTPGGEIAREVERLHVERSRSNDPRAPVPPPPPRA